MRGLGTANTNSLLDQLFRTNLGIQGNFLSMREAAQGCASAVDLGSTFTQASQLDFGRKLSQAPEAIRVIANAVL